MKNNFFVFLALTALFFASCQKEEIFEQEVEKIVIRMAIPGQNTGDLKSASMAEVIQDGDTVDIHALKNMNVVFSAENQNGEELIGTWYINLDDTDNDVENQRLWDRPKSFITNSNLVSIKPSVLGLYSVNFQNYKGTFRFFLRHTGIPGTIGDNQENDYAFRLESVKIESKGEVIKAYTLYLQVDQDELKGRGQNVDFDPNDIKNWQALLFCRDNMFTDISGQTFDAKNYSVRKCLYTSEQYICFTFFPDEAPPLIYNDVKIYRVQFYSGDYNVNWWTFNSAYKTSWNLGFGAQIEFAMF